MVPNVRFPNVCPRNEKAVEKSKARKFVKARKPISCSWRDGTRATVFHVMLRKITTKKVAAKPFLERSKLYSGASRAEAGSRAVKI